MSDKPANLPAEITPDAADKFVKVLTGIPKALIPNSVKALDRLIGAAVDIPIAMLKQHKAKIDAQTKAYEAVEQAIAKGVAKDAGADPVILEQAKSVLVRKAYRQQINRNAVGFAMIEDLRSTGEQDAASEPPPMDEDWLNLFERYAEDASTERMQKLWGRVLAGEIRKPGRYSLRTLRFVSEFSQSDAIAFSEFCQSAFGDVAPAKLVKPNAETDIRSLLFLESAGLVEGAGGLGLSRTITFTPQGTAALQEGNVILLLHAEPNAKVKEPVVALTPLGQEVLGLIPNRDVRAAARRVALAMRVPEIKAAHLAFVNGEHATPMEILWQP